MNNGFNKDGFMNWLKEEFPGVIDTLLENIIDYAIEQKNSCDDELPMFLSSMLPEIEYTEIAKFCDTDMLSGFTLEFLKQENIMNEKQKKNKCPDFNPEENNSYPLCMGAKGDRFSKLRCQECCIYTDFGEDKYDYQES